MSANSSNISSPRYGTVTEAKSGGVTYTPELLADFVAQQIADAIEDLPANAPLRILDPAVGHGELLVSLLNRLHEQVNLEIEVYGFETDPVALEIASTRLKKKFPSASYSLRATSFLHFVAQEAGESPDLFREADTRLYDLIIANPPYVRTQILGAEQAQLLAKQFGLSGRSDLYYAFILGMSQVLKPKGIAGLIVSNRFMTTKSGASVREALWNRFRIRQAWDLGDTKIFGAAVLPAVLLVEGKSATRQSLAGFTSIYETLEPPTGIAPDPIAALSQEGVIELGDRRRFRVHKGSLHTDGGPAGVWRIATEEVDSWLATVRSRSWGTFRDIGKIRVGVKTCADKVFIRKNWHETPLEKQPELLRTLTTHHNARRFKPVSQDPPRKILYTHEVAQGRRRAVDLRQYPCSEAYLEEHRTALESRKYVMDAGRNWFEVWVPHDPDAWDQPKLVFRDIAERPTFWIDLDGTIVNGDCYWLITEKSDNQDLLWLACAVGNSTFIEKFYDLRFQNKLYAGRRRFITQYVENFPLPDPHSSIGKSIIETAQSVYRSVTDSVALQKELDAMVWSAFTE